MVVVIGEVVVERAGYMAIWLGRGYKCNEQWNEKLSQTFFINLLPELLK